MEFFERVKELVKKNGITIETIAGKAGLSRNSYNSYRIKGHLPRADEAVKIAKELGVTVEELVEGTRPKEWRPPESILAIVDDMLTLDEATLKLVAKMIHAITEEQTVKEPVAHVAELERPLVGDPGASKKAKA